MVGNHAEVVHRRARSAKVDVQPNLRCGTAGRTGRRTCASPLELLERLVVLTPRPRVNLILYYGVLAPRAAWRAALVPATTDGADASKVERSVDAGEDAGHAGPSRPGAYQWAELMRRTFGFDVLGLGRCCHDNVGQTCYHKRNGEEYAHDYADRET